MSTTKHKRVTQECTVCGHQFDLMYHSDGTYTYLDEPCECEAEFIPYGPSIAEWLEQIKSSAESVSREEYEIMRADRDSWKEAFGESNEKVAEEVKRREAVERENERLRKIIIQHLPGDAVCACCEHFAQCKQEALEENDAAAQDESIFWNCDGYSHFNPKEEG